ncbi:alpha/beta hydrolase [Marinicrinis lubricantis]|uniref:Alpha/beta hydrolase n=1 Tax=Marinicrinis lubricantis TaxID=2086470 RepID=A0ABW1IVW3_9BACL
MTYLLWPEGAPHAMGTESEDQPYLEPYLIEAGEKETPCVIVFPGGGYQYRADHEGAPIAQWLNSLGISAFVLHYRVKPYSYPVPLIDAQRAIRYVRTHAQEWQIDPNRIGILGFSAGGHLAASAGVHFDFGVQDAPDPVDRISSRPDLMVLCYPVITFAKPYTHDGSMHNQLGPEPDKALIEKLSCERQVKAGTSPAFLWHTAEDGAVPVENSLMMASALSKHQVPFELHVFPHGGHGMGMAEKDEAVSQWTRLCGVWLAKQGWGA